MALFADRFLRFPDHDKHVVGKRKSILWPVYVWRVLYPEPSYYKLNIFQQGILGLARAKVTDPEEVGNLLGLAKELVVFISGTELLPRNLIDGKGITSLGIQALDDLEYAKSRQLVGYLFQDAVTNEILPRFSSSLQEIEPTGMRDGFPEFLMDRNKGQTDCPYAVQTPSMTFKALGEKDLFYAYSRYRRDYENATHLSGDEFNGPERVKIFGIELIDETPVPMYLWCWIFKDKGSEKLWLASDPFGLRKATSWMSERVSNLAKKQPTLAKIMAGFHETNSEDNITPDTWDEIEEQVMWEALSDFEWAARVPDIGRFLFGYLRQKKLVELRERPNEEQLNFLIIQSQKLIEENLKWLLGKWPGFSNHRLPNSKDWLSRSDAVSSFKNLNISAISDSVADGLAGQQPYMIKKARNTKNQSLKALLAASLYSCSEFADHTLNHIGLLSSDLEKLITLADARNKAGHASDKRYSKEETLFYANFALEWTSKFKEWY